MNEEMLFRGKKFNNGEWVEGYVVQYPSGKTEIHKNTAPLTWSLLIMRAFMQKLRGFPQMPIGAVEDYAKVIGNIFDNPELIAQMETQKVNLMTLQDKDDEKTEADAAVHQEEENPLPRLTVWEYVALHA